MHITFYEQTKIVWWELLIFVFSVAPLPTAIEPMESESVEETTALVKLTEYLSRAQRIITHFSRNFDSPISVCFFFDSGRKTDNWKFVRY